MVFQIFGQLTTNLLAELPLLCVHKLQIVSSISFRSHDSAPRATNGRRRTRTKFPYMLLFVIFLESDRSVMSFICYIYCMVAWWKLQTTVAHVSFYKIMCNLNLHLKANKYIIIYSLLNKKNKSNTKMKFNDKVTTDFVIVILLF